MNITKELITKIDELIGYGLPKGLGEPIPGQMCVEGLICFALGEEFTDKPSCVAPSLNKLKIKLNDSNWSDNQARAKGMRNLAILQLGTKDILDEQLFAEKVVMFTITDFLPWLYREQRYTWFTTELENQLKSASNLTEARAAVADAAYAGKIAAAYAAYAAANAAAYVAYAVAYAADAVAADAAYAAVAYAAAANAAAADKILAYFAKGVEKILIEMNVPAKDFI